MGNRGSDLGRAAVLLGEQFIFRHQPLVLPFELRGGFFFRNWFAFDGHTFFISAGIFITFCVNRSRSIILPGGN